MNSTLEPIFWDSIDWIDVEKEVKNLQSRIFVSKQENNCRKLRTLQKLLFKNKSNILLSLKRVLILNYSKIDIDKLTLSKNQRNLYYQLLKIDIRKYSPLSVKYLYISKLNNKKQLLKIPTLKDCCIQFMVKHCLEPEWEAYFETTSDKFRPDKSPHDALSRIYNSLSIKNTGTNHKIWVVNVGIEKLFDMVDHKYIYKKLNNFPMKHLLYKWLRAGYMKLNKLQPTEIGIQSEIVKPRILSFKNSKNGCIISPLLANIALSELGLFLKIDSNSTSIKDSRVYIRYADDFVILCSSFKEAYKTDFEISQWFLKIGLKTSSTKTRIINVRNGFDFLGINIRSLKAKSFKTKSIRKSKSLILIMRPSKKSINKFKDKLRDEWSYLRGKNISHAVNRINPIIIEWRNYFQKYSSNKVFNKLDNWNHLKCWNYASRLHPNKGKKWIYDNYFGNFVTTRNDKWVFGDKSSGLYIQKLSWASIKDRF